MSLASQHLRPKPNKWIVTLSVTFGTLMGTIDASIVNVALPHIRGSVGATLDEITWITTGFVIATVLVMPLTGFLSRQFGQKRVYLTALLVFIIGSALCATARSLQALVFYRVLQGLGAGALQPTEQAILRQTFPPKEQGMAMALFGMAVVLGPAIGPTLGGYIVDQYNWPWIFYINLPVGALGFLMVTTFVIEDPEIRTANLAIAARQRKQLDWVGIVLMCVGLTAVQYFLEEGARNDWFESSLIRWCLAVGLVSLAAFVMRELTAPAPAVDLRLFKDKAFLSASVIGAVQFAMLLGNMFLLPVFMQELLGYTAMQSGITMLPRAALMMVMNPIIGKLYNRVSPRVMVANGILWVSFGSLVMSFFTLQTGVVQIILAIMVQGLGFSCLFIPLTTAALARIPKHRLPDATGLQSLLRQLGASSGLAIFATLLIRFGTQARASLGAHITEVRPEVMARLNQITSGMVARGMDLATAQVASLRALYGTVYGQSMMLAFRKDFFLGAVAFLGVLPLLYFLKVSRDATSSPVHAE
jgi:MFS transporter, DHA2 family, multidrug resistance protein